MTKRPGTILQSISQCTVFAAAALFVFLSISVAVPAAEPVTLTEAEWASLDYTPFSEMQALDGSGNYIWGPPVQYSWTQYAPDYPQAYKLRGVVLNDPLKMLDTSAQYSAGPKYFMGGQWQVYIQTTETDPLVDFGGAALWMGQNYGNHGWHYPDYSYSYSDEQWIAEIAAMNYPIDQATGLPVTEPLRPGDLIEVRARGAVYYNGKFNCNEEHTNEEYRDFQIIVLERNVPIEPVDITLADVKYSDNSFIVDYSRATGAEFYQSQYVTLHNVTIDSVTSWGVYGGIVVADGARKIDVKLGYNAAFDGAEMPSGTFDITGIFDQEGVYRMWATSPADFTPSSALIAGDANGDGTVDEDDALRLAAHWGLADDASWYDGDFNGDYRVDAADAAILAANWGETAAEKSPVPEPSMIALGLIALVALVHTRRVSP